MSDEEFFRLRYRHMLVHPLPAFGSRDPGDIQTCRAYSQVVRARVFAAIRSCPTLGLSYRELKEALDIPTYHVTQAIATLLSEALIFRVKCEGKNGAHVPQMRFLPCQ